MLQCNRILVCAPADSQMLKKHFQITSPYDKLSNTKFGLPATICHRVILITHTRNAKYLSNVFFK